MKYLFTSRLNLFDMVMITTIISWLDRGGWDVTRLLLAALATLVGAAISTIGARYFR